MKEGVNKQEFSGEKYGIVYADPPWMFNNKNTGGSMKSGSEFQYPVMKVDDICKLPVSDICADDCFLLMWWVSSMPEEALKVVKAWGFKLKTMTGFTWLKKTVKGKDHFGMGFYTRAGAENCLIATKGHPKVCSHSIRQIQKYPVRKHSEKPSELHGAILGLCGPLQRIELFSRRRIIGWNTVGNEVDGKDIKESLDNIIQIIRERDET